MAQYAFFKRIDNWEQITPSGVLEEMNDQQYIRLDSEVTVKSEIVKIKSLNIPLVCPICEERMYFNKGYLRENDGGQYENKSPYFYHSNKDACHFAESLPHALTKRYLFSKLKEAGYMVKEEYRHLVEGKRIRADVAAFTGEGESPSLKLVVEVQASSGLLSSLIKKINTYYTESAPTAWVILLDEFFTGYSGITDSIYNHVTGEYDTHTLETGEENYFAVTGKDSKIFTLLMNEYGYVLAINNKGHVYLIRRDPKNEHRRIAAILLKQYWTTQDEVYLITRVADKDIVPTLSLTPLIRVQELEEQETTSGVPAGSYKDGIHSTQGHVESSAIETPFSGDSKFMIDELIGEDANKALNPLSLIMETWRAQEKARNDLLLEIAEEKRLAEEKKRRSTEIKLSISEADEKIDRKESSAADKEKLEVINNFDLQRKAEERAYINQLLHDLNEDFSFNRENEFKRSSGKQRPKNKMLDEIEELLPLYGMKLESPMDIYGLNETEALDFIDFIVGRSTNRPAVNCIQSRDTIWESYVSLTPNKRPQLERNLFKEGLPGWFMDLKFPFDRKQIETQKKMMRENKQMKSRTLNNPGLEEQMGFDF
ncbi:hypothetical protein ACK8P5_12915 [Paenibacillus sp. EC2-1]|uniref:hypothetical protein n=1 Tax=Paenibacillus sp. EC2-1 TaxID=3388665 RepID=UPI003BEF330A